MNARYVEVELGKVDMFNRVVCMFACLIVLVLVLPNMAQTAMLRCSHEIDNPVLII